MPNVLVVRIVLTIVQDLRAAKAATVVGGDVDGAVDRNTTCPYAASVSEFMSQRRDQGRARTAPSILAARSVLTIAQDLRAAKAVTVVGGDVGRAVVDRSTACPYALSVSQLMSQHRDYACACTAPSVFVVRAVITLAQDLRDGKTAAVIGGDVGRAVTKSTTCPYVAVAASFTKVTKGSASC